VIYVDDLLIFGKQLDLIKDLKHELQASFSMMDISPYIFYLGIEVIQDRKAGIITLYQAGYIEKVLKAFRMANCHPVATPLEPKV
jgi:Reverse transcriptase (RNA-dependent DNA polymerase)